MDMNLNSFVKVYPGWLDSLACDEAVSHLSTAPWERHFFLSHDGNERVYPSGGKEFSVFHGGIPHTDYFTKQTWEAYKAYVTGLDFPWFQGWAGFSPVRFHKYEEGQVMAKHCDHIHSLFHGPQKGVPTMTCLSVLNDEYEGGELVLFDDTVLEVGKGTVIVFPSCFLFPHEVRPVTSGVRFSSVSWAW